MLRFGVGSFERHTVKIVPLKAEPPFGIGPRYRAGEIPAEPLNRYVGRQFSAAFDNDAAEEHKWKL